VKSYVYRLALVAVAASALAGCRQSAAKREDAIRLGVIDYLSTRSGLDVNAMNVEVTAVALRRDEADATVSIRARGNTDPAGAMTMRYTLERKGDKWVVKGKSGGGAAHGGGAEGGGAGALPPGHPSTTRPSNPDGVDPHGAKK
jgi:hypothetical protein